MIFSFIARCTEALTRVEVEQSEGVKDLNMILHEGRKRERYCCCYCCCCYCLMTVLLSYYINVVM
jgi:hypothetical protein